MQNIGGYRLQVTPKGQNPSRTSRSHTKKEIPYQLSGVPWRFKWISGLQRPQTFKIITTEMMLNWINLSQIPQSSFSRQSIFYVSDTKHFWLKGYWMAQIINHIICSSITQAISNPHYTLLSHFSWHGFHTIHPSIRKPCGGRTTLSEVIMEKVFAQGTRSFGQ